MLEQWKSIKGYEGLYEVSNTGNVKSLDRVDFGGRNLQGKILSNSSNGNYITCVLRKDGKSKTHRVHKIVAEAFIENPNNLRCINHINGIKTDNRVENLEWCTHSENMKHAYKYGLLKPTRKLTHDDLIDIVNNKGVVSSSVLSKRYNVSFQYICTIWKRGVTY